MTRTRLFAACAVAAALLAAVPAAAQFTEAASAVRVAPAPSGAAAAAVSRVSVGVAPAGLTALPTALAPSALTAAPAASIAAPKAAVAAAPLAAAPKAAALPNRLPAAGDGPTPLQEPIHPGERWYGDPRLGTGDQMVHDGPRGRNLVPLSSFEPAVEPVDWRSSRAKLDKTFDGAAARSASVSDPVAGSASAPKPLAPVAAAPKAAPASVPAAATPARRSAGLSLGWKIALALALMLFTPAVALAQTAAAPVTMSVGGTLAILAALRPAAAVVGGIAGAIYGMAAARPKDGSEASSAEIFGSVLRYGALGASAVYMIFDVTNLAFMGGTGAGIQPLSAAIVTAALGRTAFQGKFKDLATTSADRIVGAFPAVAAAMGISLGVAAGFVAPPLLTTLALGAMTVTGVATAVYTAVFKPGRSPMAGPATMGKGYVLQALMTGMALATTGTWLAPVFGVMGAAGFGLVLWGLGRELYSLLPGQGEPLPPAPPAPPAPPTGKEPPPIGGGPTTTA
ncbi:MAG: hypothetical protein HY079_05535 [Elusimicrobia bacterium]|nr:hypothetical protein [Elusimicrobiota bacterium]